MSSSSSSSNTSSHSAPSAAPPSSSSSSSSTANSYHNAAATQVYTGTLRILTVNDVYSYSADRNGLGGWSTLAALLDAHRTPNSLFCVNGDFLGGSTLAEFHKGANVQETMEALETDVVVLGNHEFDYGTAALQNLMRKSKFPYLGNNVHDATTNQQLEGTTPYFRVECRLDPLGAVSPGFPSSWPAHIGCFGVCTQLTPSLSWPDATTRFEDVATTTEHCIQQLRRGEGAGVTLSLPRALHARAVASVSPSPPSDILIGLTHLPLSADLALSRQFGAHLHLLLGGHDHDAVAMQGDYSTLIFKCGQNALWLGIVDLELIVTVSHAHRNNNTAEMDGAPRFTHTVQVIPSWRMVANSNQPSSPMIDAITRRYEVEMEEARSRLENLNEVVCEILESDAADDVFTTRTSIVRKSSSAFPSLLVDAMYHVFAESGCDLAIINGGFIRGDRDYAAGPITLRSVREEFPFPLCPVLVKIEGKWLQLALSEMLALTPAASGSFPHVSANMQLDYAWQSKSVHIRVRAQRSIRLSIEDDASATANGNNEEWSDLEPQRIYTVCTSSFLAGGGDGISAFKKGVIVQNSNELISDCFLKYVRKLQKIKPDFKPRVRILDA